MGSGWPDHRSYISETPHYMAQFPAIAFALYNNHFKEAELDRFHDKLVEQICELSGGPCKYSGKAMKKLHSDFEINEAQFNALVEALMLSMDNNKISVGAQNQLLALLVPMRKDIVNH